MDIMWFGGTQGRTNKVIFPHTFSLFYFPPYVMSAEEIMWEKFFPYCSIHDRLHNRRCCAPLNRMFPQHLSPKIPTWDGRFISCDTAHIYNKKILSTNTHK